MNARSVSKSAVLRLGMLLTAILVLTSCLRPAKGSEIVVTVTGEIVGGAGDFLHIFGKERNIAGKPFTVVFTFDDTKGRRTPLAGCTGSATGIQGDGGNSPGIAVLTIEGKSFTFGTHKVTHSEIWREVRSACSESQIAIEVEDDNALRGGSINNVNLHPSDQRHPFTQNPDWRSPLSSSAIHDDSLGGFAIQGPNATGDGGVFSVKSITVASK